jgi:putative iron-regulated protein
MTKSFLRSAALALATATSMLTLQPAHAATDAAAVVKHYADVAHAKFSDALSGNRSLSFRQPDR